MAGIARVESGHGCPRYLSSVMPDTQHAIHGYDHYHQMLGDPVRMGAFREAIFATVKPGDIVVDLGAGTGVLGFWALQAGAKKVYVIEKTEAIDLARELAVANGLEEKVEFIQKNSMDVELPERANVLISETLGSFAIDENTLQFTCDARDRFLVEGGQMIPQTLELFVAPLQDPEIYEKIDFWRHIPGLDFSAAFEMFSKKIMIEEVAGDKLLTDPVSLAKIDLRLVPNGVFESRAFISIKKSGTIHGVAGWFTVDLTDQIQISTAPEAPLTHWKQAVFPFPEPINVTEGDIMDWATSLGVREENSDHTQISYHYRCSQISGEEDPRAAAQNIKNSPCPCGSGEKFSNCCLKIS
jgi:protein arginine N-methyltransferase 1